MASPIVTKFEVQTGTTNTLFAKWTWDKNHTANYKTKWQYKVDTLTTGSQGWFDGQEGSPSTKQETWGIPSNAKKIRFKVKAVSETYQDSNNNEHSYWTSDWSSWVYFVVAEEAPPSAPSTPQVELDELYNLTMSLEGLTYPKGSQIQFAIAVDGSNTLQRSSWLDIPITNAVSYVVTLQPGKTYRVKARARTTTDNISEWSAYSSATLTPPPVPWEITECRATSLTSIYISWSESPTATSYELQYAEKISDFFYQDTATSITGILYNSFEKTGLQTGKVYVFRVRAVNSAGNSPWSVSYGRVSLGKKPNPPTTWSSTTTVSVTDTVVLYWLHNAEDNSKQTAATIVLSSPSAKQKEINVTGETTSYTLKSADLPEFFKDGAVINWKVKTKGALDDYSDFSEEKTINVYISPSLEMHLTDGTGNEVIDTVISYPLTVTGIYVAANQKPITYLLEIIANNNFDSQDSYGNDIVVTKGTVLYSEHFDIDTNFSKILTPKDVKLDNNGEYTLNLYVTMNSGLIGWGQYIFTVAWSQTVPEPNAEIAINRDTYQAYIRPYCIFNTGFKPVKMYLSVYRRENDGRFTTIMENIEQATDGNRYIYATDPHPALDSARYRIVAKSSTTGEMNYYDVPGIEFGEKAIIIQWDENYVPYDIDTNDRVKESNGWNGSLLKLPYNIDVDNKIAKDVTLVEYAGRENPVSYYGVLKKQTGSWKVEVPKNDKETLYQLQRLNLYCGDVYVREPSGVGYWANINVTFSLTHLAVTVPVTLEITRVEGGM